MTGFRRLRPFTGRACRFEVLLLTAVGSMAVFLPRIEAGPWLKRRHAPACEGAACAPGNGALGAESAGTWYWMRSPEEERRVVANLYTRYCMRCHGNDGRGVWDMPDVPDFTNARWQASRSDAQLARIILEGRGAVMPPFRGTLTLEESWAMARYLHTFGPSPEFVQPRTDK
jgi:hypothetical protein